MTPVCRHATWEMRPDLAALAPGALTQFGGFAIRRCRECGQIEGGSWNGSGYDWRRVAPELEDRLNARPPGRG